MFLEKYLRGPPRRGGIFVIGSEHYQSENIVTIIGEETLQNSTKLVLKHSRTADGQNSADRGTFFKTLEISNVLDDLRCNLFFMLGLGETNFFPWVQGGGRGIFTPKGWGESPENPKSTKFQPF